MTNAFIPSNCIEFFDKLRTCNLPNPPLLIIKHIDLILSLVKPQSIKINYIYILDKFTVSIKGDFLELNI